jgi:hypothetical protein
MWRSLDVFLAIHETKHMAAKGRCGWSCGSAAYHQNLSLALGTLLPPHRYSDVCHHKRMLPMTACSICGIDDSWRHALLECIMLQCVWVLSDPTITEHISPAKEWLLLMMESMEKDDLVKILVTLWSIWHDQRKVIHEDIFPKFAGHHRFLRASSMNLGMSGKKNRQTKGASADRVRAQRWVPPPTTCYKMNMDVVFTRLANRGTVGVVCDTSPTYP